MLDLPDQVVVWSAHDAYASDALTEALLQVCKSGTVRELRGRRVFVRSRHECGSFAHRTAVSLPRET